MLSARAGSSETTKALGCGGAHGLRKGGEQPEVRRLRPGGVRSHAAGRFDHPGFLGWGRAATDAQGNYAFHTIKPGAGAGRAPHINFLILYSGLMRQLQTVMFFENSNDPVLQAVGNPERLIATTEGRNRYRFDIRLRGGEETPFFDD